MAVWLRYGAFAFLAVVVLLIALAVVSGADEAPQGEDRIVLESASVRLFPRSDPGAVWRFEAPVVRYDLASGEASLEPVQEGSRAVGGKVDFRLSAPSITVRSNDDLRANTLNVFLVEDDLNVDLRASSERQVLVDHRAGRFEVPSLRMHGEGFGESRYEDVTTNFDFTEFEAGGPGTVGFSRFEVEEAP